MARVRKRSWTNAQGKQTAWIADYSDQSGKRHIKTFSRKKDADAWLVTTCGEVKEGIHTSASASITVAEAAQAWLRQAEIDGLERSTRREYERYVSAHIVPQLGAQKLAALSVASVKAFRNTLAAASLSPAMRKKIVGSLGAILADAQSAGRVGQNVVHAEAIKNKTATRRRRMVEKRQERRIEEGVDYPTKAELRALLSAPSPHHVLIDFALATGMRASELRGLEWGHVDLDGGMVHVSQRADRWNAIGDTKSASGRRDIPLSPEIVALLREWKLRCPRGERETVKFVFPNGEGKIEYLSNWHNRALARLQRGAGIVKPAFDDDGKPVMEPVLGEKGKPVIGNDGTPVMRQALRPKYGMHSLRHAAISLWIEAGLSPKEVQSLAGHSTIQMTFDVYGHLWRAERDDGARMSAIRSRLLAT